jgi:hypothetical protein
VVGFVGKVGPTIAGFAEGQANAVSSAFTESTDIKGPATRTITTYGTNSKTNITVGALSNTELTAGPRSTMSVAVQHSELKISALASASIKVAGLKAVEFNIALVGTSSTVFSPGASLQNDLTNRVINQAPTLVVNALNVVKSVVNETGGHVNKSHLASMHSFASLMHLLF